MSVRCPTCSTGFETPEELHEHTAREHPTDDARSVGERVTCPRCGAEMSSRDSLETHMHDAHGA